MANSLPIIQLDKDQWIDIYAVTGIAVGTILEIQSLNAGDVRVHIGPTQPDDADGHELVIKAGKTVTPPSPSGIWAFSQMGGAVYVRPYVGETTPVPIALFDGDNNPISSLKGAIDIHDADVHDVPVNELFHRHTGVSTTLAAITVAGVTTSIQVDDGALFNNGDIFQIEETVSGITTIEVTFPTIIAGGTTNTFTLDRPLDNSFGIGASVEVVTTNMAVNGSLVAPVIFQLIPDSLQEWHVVRFLLGMIHAAAADDSRFGDIAGGLQNGCVLRGFDGASGRYRTFTNWKTNSDIKMDMFDLTYTDKAGGGNFGSNGRGSIRDGTGAAPKLDGVTGGLLELIVQDDLTTLIDFKLKGQGHIEGL